LKTEPSIRVNSGRDKDMDLVFKLGPMAHATRGSGLTIKPTAEEYFITLMETSSMGTGRLTKQMDLGHTTTLMEVSTKGCGSMTYKTEKVEKHGKTHQRMKVSIKRVRSTVKVCMFGLMGAYIADHG
jgi:hypothetical protein